MAIADCGLAIVDWRLRPQDVPLGLIAVDGHRGRRAISRPREGRSPLRRSVRKLRVRAPQRRDAPQIAPRGPGSRQRPRQPKSSSAYVVCGSSLISDDASIRNRGMVQVAPGAGSTFLFAPRGRGGFGRGRKPPEMHALCIEPRRGDRSVPSEEMLPAVEPCPNSKSAICNRQSAIANLQSRCVGAPGPTPSRRSPRGRLPPSGRGARAPRGACGRLS